MGACPGKTLGFGRGGPRGGALPEPPCCWGLNPGGKPWGGNPWEFWGNNPDGSLGYRKNNKKSIKILYYPAIKNPIQQKRTFSLSNFFWNF